MNHCTMRRPPVPHSALTSLPQPLLLACFVLAAPTIVIASEAKATDVEVADENVDAPPTRRAYKLGDFRIKNFRPVEREKLTLEFTVYVESLEGQQQRFERVWQNHEHRVRNQVITSARLVPPNEFDDPALEALRRRIYLRLRRAVPELPIDKVFVTEFSYLLE